MNPSGRRRTNTVTVTANGDYDLIKTVCPYGTITVDGTGTITVGRRNMLGAFVAYTNGIADAGGIVVDHGVGVGLAFNVAGIASTVDVTYAPGCSLP